MDWANFLACVARLRQASAVSSDIAQLPLVGLHHNEKSKGLFRLM